MAEAVTVERTGPSGKSCSLPSACAELGRSMVDAPDVPFHDPVADADLVGELKAGLRPGIEVVEMATHINDPAFARAVAERLDEPDRSSATPEAAEAGESISVERLPTEVANAEKMRRFKRITRPATPVA